MTGAAPRFSAGHARRLAGGLGQVQFLVADQTYPTETQTPVARRRLGQPGDWVPVELDQSFAFSSPDHHVQALHRHEQFQCLDPLRRHAQRVIVAQVVELGAVFALDGRHPQRLAPSIGLGLFSVAARKGGETLQRPAPQVVVIGMYPRPVAIEPPVHGAQERFQLAPQPIIQQGLEPRREER